MAKTDEKIMALVEKELKKKPDASVDQLYEKAKGADSSIGDLTRRQFNARYPLQVKRRMSRKAPGRKSRRRATRARRAASGGNERREKVRQTFLRFASDLAAAEERKDLVDVLAGVDKYVDQALKAADSR